MTDTPWMIYPCDCRDAMSLLMEPDSVDSIVTDPPYDLVSISKRFGKPGAAPASYGTDGAFQRASGGFMGARWDSTGVAFEERTWAEAYRVLKPGGYLLAFGGTRTFHRMVCAIEDAGFEIRDAIMWHYGQGFAKSLNVNKQLEKLEASCQCHKTSVSSHNVSDQNLHSVLATLDAHHSLSGGAQQDVRPEMRGGDSAPPVQGQGEAPAATGGADASDVLSVRDAVLAQREARAAGGGADVLGVVQRQETQPSAGKTLAGERTTQGATRPQSEIAGSEQPGLEGRSDDAGPQGQLCRFGLCALPAGVCEHVSEGRLCDAAPAGDGAMDRATADTNRDGASCEPQPEGRRPQQPRIVPVQSQSQDGGAWPHCGGCGKPMVPEGLGTALKPATEPICVARKPLSEPSVAANVLRWGTGAINIDGARVGTSGGTKRGDHDPNLGRSFSGDFTRGNFGVETLNAGRFPANLIHDGSDAVAALFPSTESRFFYAAEGGDDDLPRLVYCPKASKADRDQGLDDLPEQDAGGVLRMRSDDHSRRVGNVAAPRRNTHPTVKPESLMRYLVRLVTPPGGTVFDPFTGSGSTGKAALLEGFRFVGCELTPEYLPIIEARLTDAAKRARGEV